MIRLGFFEQHEEPTLWMHLGSHSDFQTLCGIFADLASGARSSVNTIEHSELFAGMPEVSDLTFSALPIDGDKANIQWREGHFKWEMSHDQWKFALEQVRDLPPNRHAYLEYDDATVSVSFMEALREGL